MKKYNDKKVLVVLQDLYEQTLTPKKMSISQFFSEHKMGTTFGLILVHNKFLLRKPVGRHQYEYTWNGNRPNIYMAQKTIEKVQERREFIANSKEEKKTRIPAEEFVINTRQEQEVQATIPFNSQVAYEVEVANKVVSNAEPVEHLDNLRVDAPIKNRRTQAEIHGANTTTNKKIKTRKISILWGAISINW